jgi:patatin-related protein
MTPEPSTAKRNANPQTVLGPDREVRFAVVMYGGVSLAIYINGVAQELLNLVRATAPKSDDPDETELLLSESELTGAGSVYRQLGRFLHGDRSKLTDSETDEAIPVKTRFIVDVISGTSAGGINGVFLAKALTRNQTMDGLKRLWLTEGDLDKLLNDKRSISDLSGFKLKRPQESLLNSQRMYRKLLEALDQMSKPAKQTAMVEKRSPLVGELDLFITTTDIDGIPLPIGLSDEVVYERRFKNVFHFRYSTEQATGSSRDDFIKANDPFLAFAARCTSSFPFAFEAMRLRDITEIANAFPPYQDETARGAWDRFFSDYLRNGLFDLDREARGDDATGRLPADLNTEEKARVGLRESFCARSFGDGGYLDNKPFSYATSRLMHRHADRAVARKLLYVEPSPEHPELTVPKTDPPDFAQNVYAAVLDLPRQETIREDIDRLYERNELLIRVTMLAKEVDADMAANKSKPISDRKFDKQGLREMISHYGVSYGAYHRLKVTELTALLAELITRAAGHDPVSDAGDAIRELVKAWRRGRYHPLRPRQRKDPEDKDKETENAFLRKFDIRYDLRRLGFLSRRINQLIELDEDAMRLLVPLSALRGWPKKLNVETLSPRDRTDFQNELNWIKRFEISPALQAARSAEERLRTGDSEIGEKLYKAINALQIGWPDLESVLNCDPGAARDEKAKDVLGGKGSERDKALSDLADVIADGFKWEAPPHMNSTNSGAGALAARFCVRHYRTNFIFYDLVTYPVEYGTGAGEANVVDVFRVSPEDAVGIFNQRKSGRKKLAGTYLMSFGAFLDEGWRRNDMLWGRLDGTERIIRALLPEKNDEGVRNKLIEQAQRSILAEESKAGGLIEARPDFDTPDKIWKFYKDDFRVDQSLPPKTAFNLISRATNVTGNMFEFLSERHHLDLGERIGAGIARVGPVLWKITAVIFALGASVRKLFRRSS